jgi:hypothetical protein
MATEPKPSFSRHRKWRFGFDAVVRTAVVFAVVVMVNYLANRYYHRQFLSEQTRIHLSPRTVSVVNALTNQVKVTLYYDKEDRLYPDVLALLNEYRNLNPRLQITTVDYRWDAAEAQRVKKDYKLPEAVDATEKSEPKNEKNFVIFDSAGRQKVVNGNALADFQLEQTANNKDSKGLEFQRKLTAFHGEQLFTACLLAISNPKPFKAYVLQGHGEHNLESGDEVSGYLNFKLLLQRNYIQPEPLYLIGTNGVPPDCNLLIIPGPRTPIPETALEQIALYLAEGGRLFALFNAFPDRPTGLEKILFTDWGILVGNSIVRDPDHSAYRAKGGGEAADVVVGAFAKHPVVTALLGYNLNFIQPRPISPTAARDKTAEAPKVEVIIATEETATLNDDPTRKRRRYPLAVAVEKAAPLGVVTVRGSTRMIVVGDSLFLGNEPIKRFANADFGEYAVNWLLDRPQLTTGIGPSKFTEFRVLLTAQQLHTIQWLLLAVLPGSVLLLGVVVWMRRQK